MTAPDQIVTRPGRASGTRRVAAVGFGIIVALAINELVIGVAAPAFNPRQQVHFVDPDGAGPRPPRGEPDTVTRLAKNTGDYDVSVRINRHGFRDKKDVSTAGPDDYVMVGDSFTFGWGVEEESRLSDVLQRLTGQRVFNIGVTGDFNTYQALLDYATRLGAKLRRVIVCVTMENDIGRYGPPIAQDTAAAAAPEPAPKQPAAGIMFIVKNWLMQNSALYFAATTAVHGVPWLEDLAVQAGLIVRNLEGIREEAYDAVALDRSLEPLARLAKRYDTTIVLIPSRALWHGNKTRDAGRMNDAFAARLRGLGFDVVDLRAAFERSGRPLDFHFRNDGHWNPRGHALAAETIARHLLRH